MDSCAHCGKEGAPALCARCKSARYCGPACQRAAWQSGHRQLCSQPASKTNEYAAPAPKEESWPVRCPPELLAGPLRRVHRLDCAQAQELLCEGQAFVAPAEGLLGRRLLKWDFPYLEKHLPAEQKYGVMLDEEGSGKIVMSHSARNGQRQIDAATGEASDAPAGSTEDELFSTSNQTRMTFKDFLAEAERFRSSGRQGKLPYFGVHLLWRFKEGDNGYLGSVDEEMADDLWSIKFDVIREWQEMNVLPLVQRFYLFAGLGGTLYHCHYDLQPNLHVQLTGRKRFILFPPDNWPNLYPFPVHHDLDRRAMVDLDAPDEGRFPRWRGARGRIVELEPGDALYIPPYWWHHVQSLTPETTSMAMWFFEHFPQSSEVCYGLSPLAGDLVLMRDVEELIGKHFADVPGEEDCSKPRPVKASQTAAFVRWLLPLLGASSVASKAVQPLAGPPQDLLKPADEVQAALLKLVTMRLEEQGFAAAADAKLRELLEGRF
eukprot:TRINITY_DN32965_c0_g1_i1.p1 TRINITY_DN32965_c0_g1~~TRINITY_DN32965_c0_g1_i1.p1  ORF type:complete len:490 (-),score=100.25 TRINITY_DN32965_c0_g1_i1:31-1500(-)